MTRPSKRVERAARGLRTGASTTVLALASILAATMAVSAQTPSAPAAPPTNDAAAPASGAAAQASGTTAPKARPKILIGPTRITLLDGKTIDGIGAIQEATRIRLILEDGTEIVLDPAKVESVRPLSDFPPEVPPAAATAGKGTKPTKGAAKNAAAKGKVTDVSAAQRTKDDDELAAMLEQAIRREEEARAREKEGDQPAPEEKEGEAPAGESGTGEGEPGTATEGAGETGTGEAGYGAAGGGDTTAADAKAKEAEAAAAAAAKGPKPEDLDATRPVVSSGIRHVGPGSGPEYPETAPYQDFPKPSKPTTSLGASQWRPDDGFRQPSSWSKPLPPSTSFSRSLSGWGAPTTSLGARWWAPVPTKWPTSLNATSWAPNDGFAKQRESRRQFREEKSETEENSSETGKD